MDKEKSNITFPYEVGPEQTQPILLADFNIVTQTRSEYNSEGIDELAHSMLVRDSEGVVTDLKLINPPLLGRFTEESAAHYLYQLNTLFGTSHTVADLTPNADGKYNILIAGHRRSLALTQAVEACSGTPNDLFVRSVVLDDIDFDEAFKQQTLENIYERPALQDEAEAIAKYCEYRRNSGGKQISVAECARELSLKEKKVRNAIKYSELPTNVKKFVNLGALSYTDGVLINDVQRAYKMRENQRTQLDPENIDTSNHLTETFAIRVMNRCARRDVGERFDAKRFIKMIQGEIDSVRQAISHTEGFFEAEVISATPTAQRSIAISRLTDTMLMFAGIVHQNSPEQIDAFIERLFAMIPDQKLESELSAQLIVE